MDNRELTFVYNADGGIGDACENLNDLKEIVREHV